MADLVIGGMTFSGGLTLSAPIPPIMTIGSRTISYSSGKIFDYVDPVIGAATAGTAVDLTVDKPISCSIQLIAGPGSTNSGAVGGTAGGGVVTFTFQPGVTYKVMIGTSGKRSVGGLTTYGQQAGVPGGGLGTIAGFHSAAVGGGGYSGIFTSSVSVANALVVVAGGGGGSTTAGGYGGIGGPASQTPITQGGGGGYTAAAPGNRPGSGASTSAGGGGPAYSGSALQGGDGSSSGGGGGGLYGGGGGAGGSAGGGGSSYANTTAGVSAGTGIAGGGSFGGYNTPITYNRITGTIDSLGTYFGAHSGLAGNVSGVFGNTGDNYGFDTILSRINGGTAGSWSAPWVSQVSTVGPATPGSGYTVVLANDHSPGATTLNLAVRAVATGNSSSDSSIAVGGDIRRFCSNDATTTWVACTVNAYTADNGTLIGSWTTSTTQNTANALAINGTLGATIPAGAPIYLIAQPYILSVSASGISANTIIRVAETAGASPAYWHYNCANATANTALVQTINSGIYPVTGTLPRGAQVQRAAITSTTGPILLTDIGTGLAGSMRIKMT